MFQHYKKNLQHGSGISIVDNVISATGGGGGGSYTAGTNIDITNNVISTIGDTIKPLTDLTINIYELSNGIYSVGNGQTLRCKSDNTKNINVSCSGKLIVSIYPSTNERIFYLFGGYNNTSTLITGTATANQGDFEIMNLNIATNITSSSTNTEIASAKSVYDIKNKLSLILASHARQEINFPSAWTHVNIPVDTADISSNDYTISNGSVIVGNKPKVVEINLTIPMDGITSGTHNIGLYKKNPNSTEKSIVAYSFSGITPIWTVTLNAVTEVEEGTEIYIIGSKNTSGSLYCASTNLMIKTLSEVALT